MGPDKVMQAEGTASNDDSVFLAYMIVMCMYNANKLILLLLIRIKDYKKKIPLCVEISYIVLMVVPVEDWIFALFYILEKNHHKKFIEFDVV